MTTVHPHDPGPAPMPPARFTVDGPSGRITGWTRGSPAAVDRLPVLLIHGVNGASEEWDAVAQALSPRRQVIALDLRAHGGSAPGEGYRAEDYAADAAAVLDALAVTETHVVGSSFGGLAALALAVASPRRVRTVLTLGTAGGGSPEAVRLIESRMAELGVRGFYEWAMANYAFGPEAGDTAPRAAVERACRNDRETALAILRAAFGQDGLPIAARVGRPVLVTTGENDRTCPPEAVRPLAETLGAPLNVLEGAAHLPHLEQPEKIAALVENHARAHESGTPRVVPGRTIAELAELRTLTGDANGAQRVCWTAPWRSARDWLDAKLAAVPGVRTERDAAGNLWATLPGATPTALIVGSHLDSVPDGGWLDGCYGVLAGLELLRAYAAGGTPPVTLCLVDWADEEGVRFGRSLYGSAAATGLLDAAALRGRRDSGGREAAAVLAEHGVDLDRLGAPSGRLRQAAAYLELHIEQGPVLERAGLSLAAVSGTLGVERHRLRVRGQSAHAGATPLSMRRDPLAAAARVVLAARELAAEFAGLATSGSIRAEPGVATAVPREVTLTLDLRHSDGEALGRLYRSLRDTAAGIADAERVELGWEPLWSTAPVSFDSGLTELAATTVERLCGSRRTVPSGPLHDAVEMARYGVPTAMIFAQSGAGLSHTREEDTRADHLELGVRALADLAADVIRRSVREGS